MFKKLNNNGFTAIELLVVILVLTAVAVVAVTNIRAIRAENRDFEAKSEINAIYYQLEAYYEANKNYPATISTESLKGLDPEATKDSLGLEVNAIGSTYTYEPKECAEEKCESYKLSAELEREDTFVKESLN